MKFVLPQSLLRDACLQKVSKNLKIKCGQVTLAKTGLVTLGTFNPLGVKRDGNMLVSNKEEEFSKLVKFILYLSRYCEGIWTLQKGFSIFATPS
jgi:hypothetical protein